MIVLFVLVAVHLERHVDLARIADGPRIVILVHDLAISIKCHGDEVCLVADALELPR